jgi:DNA-binding helix-hairpin-helix protein with protein kinase domain
LVYGDISPNNVFLGDGKSREVWLIDADNLRFERSEGGNAVYTPHYGAPEIVQGREQSRPRTDCWAFAVMAFGTLALCHPFIGKKVLEPDSDAGGWDAEPAADGVPADLDEQAYAGYLPFIDDDDDDTNAAVSGLPRELVTTTGLRRLFQETFGVGRTQPHRRPLMLFWTIELARAFDQTLVCPECKMSYFADDYEKCPYCDTSRPAFARAKTNRWKVLIPADAKEFVLPHRIFNAFSFEHYDDPECEAVLDFASKTAIPVRGTRPFPDGLTFDFVEAAK